MTAKILQFPKKETKKEEKTYSEQVSEENKKFSSLREKFEYVESLLDNDGPEDDGPSAA